MKSNTWIVLLLVTSVAMCETIAQSFLKEYSMTKHQRYLIYGIIFYTILCFFSVKTLQYRKMALVNATWNSVAILLILFSDAYFFGESFTKYEIAGIVFIIIGIVLMEFE